MSQQTINNGESGLDVRNKINANFTELYTGKDSVTVNAYADLPDPTTVSGQRYWVLTSTGVYLINRRNAGAYYSDGAVWTWLGNNPTTADQIGNVPAGGIAATDVQAALNELDTDKLATGAAAASATQLATGRTIAITGDLTWNSGSFNGSANVTAAGTLATVNSNVGTFGSGALVPVITVNAKGLVTAVTTAAVSGGGGGLSQPQVMARNLGC